MVEQHAAITLPLPANKTYRCREITWQPTPIPWVGILTIVESVGPTTKVKVSRYAVSEILPLERDTRRFRMTKAGGNTHYTEVGGRFALCQCHGFLSGHHCRHVQSLETLQKAGYLREGT
jgi:hypothetical protein